MADTSLVRNWLKSGPDKGPPSTLRRLCTSQHLGDLQLLALISAVVFLVSSVFFVAPFVVDAIGESHKDDVLAVICPVQPDEGGQGVRPPTAVYLCAEKRTKSSSPSWLSSTFFNAIAGAILAAAAAALNWAYQTGSLRLGAVDLFGCEISAICRVCLIVDFAKTSVAAANDMSVLPVKFTSEEHYTPVYDGNLSDLKPLDVTVVTHVTQFYTYRKTMMDYLRRVAVTEDAEKRASCWQQMIYMQFLMYESAREAIFLLIEFEPNQAESLINILSSELVLYRYLLEIHSGDYRTKRLRLRIWDYGRIVPYLVSRVDQYGQLPRWQRARTTAQVLIDNYEELRKVLPEELPDASLRNVADFEWKPPMERYAG